jgi:CBS domain-containing protein
MKVRDCMCNQVSCVNPQTTINDVAKLMQQNHVGCIPVCDTNKNVVGLVTDRDIVLRGVACNKNTNTTPISEIMTTAVYTVTPDEELTQASKIMCDCQIKRVPVIENDTIVGIITLGDLVNAEGVNSKQVTTTVEGICRCGNDSKNNQ